MSLRIGNVVADNQVVAAPMAGVSNLAYRTLVKEMGAGLIVTEMVSDHALLYGHQQTRAMLRLSREERPTGIQLFGGSPETMAEAARIVEAEAEPDYIDINMGCPAPKICKGGGGSALLREPVLAGQIIEAVVKAVSVPVTVKIRIGWDDASVNAVEMARLAEACGAQAVTVHGRTRAQHYSGEARWDVIRQVVEAVSIPVIGNGDAWTPERAKQLLDTTGAAGVAIARPALGNPWIFRRTAHYLATGELLPEPTVEDRVAVALRHLQMLVELKGEHTGVREFRKHAAYYTKTVRGGAAARNELMKCETEAEMAATLRRLPEFAAADLERIA